MAGAHLRLCAANRTGAHQAIVVDDSEGIAERLDAADARSRRQLRRPVAGPGDEPSTPGQFRTSLPLEVLPRVPVRDAAAEPAVGSGRTPGARPDGAHPDRQRRQTEYQLGPVDQIPAGRGPRLRRRRRPGCRLPARATAAFVLFPRSARTRADPSPTGRSTTGRPLPAPPDAFELDTGCSTTGPHRSDLSRAIRRRPDRRLPPTDNPATAGRN